MDSIIKSDINEIKTDIAEIKIDLKYHVKRTNDLQDMITPLVELKTEIKGIIKLVKFIGVIAGILEAARWYIK